jgi:hypothetical protein
LGGTCQSSLENKSIASCKLALKTAISSHKKLLEKSGTEILNSFDIDNNSNYFFIPILNITAVLDWVRGQADEGVPEDNFWRAMEELYFVYCDIVKFRIHFKHQLKFWNQLHELVQPRMLGSFFLLRSDRVREIEHLLCKINFVWESAREMFDAYGSFLAQVKDGFTQKLHKQNNKIDV